MQNQSNFTHEEVLWKNNSRTFIDQKLKQEFNENVWKTVISSNENRVQENNETIYF